MSTFEYKAWPYHEAQTILEKLERESKAGIERKHDFVLLETVDDAIKVAFSAPKRKKRTSKAKRRTRK